MHTFVVNIESSCFSGEIHEHRMSCHKTFLHCSKLHSFIILNALLTRCCHECLSFTIWLMSVNFSRFELLIPKLPFEDVHIHVHTILSILLCHTCLDILRYYSFYWEFIYLFALFLGSK